MIAEIVTKNIVKRRKERGLTQEEVGVVLGLSRATYNGLEKGKRPATMEDLEKLAKLYGVSVASFFNEPRNDAKFEQMYFYILRHFRRGVPKTKLAKMLYLADFSTFYDNLKPMSGVRYIRRQYGPVADVFFELTENLYDQGRINIEPMESTLLIRATSNDAGEDLLTKSDKERMDEICRLWGDRRTAEIVQFTHEQKPWKSCRDGEDIPYSLIIQEDPGHVYTPT